MLGPARSILSRFISINNWSNSRSFLSRNSGGSALATHRTPCISSSIAVRSSKVSLSSASDINLFMVKFDGRSSGGSIPPCRSVEDEDDRLLSSMVVVGGSAEGVWGRNDRNRLQTCPRELRSVRVVLYLLWNAVENSSRKMLWETVISFELLPIIRVEDV